jgi:hypothetical protein
MSNVEVRFLSNGLDTNGSLGFPFYLLQNEWIDHSGRIAMQRALLWLLLAAFLAAASPAVAQEFRGAISGTVTDSKGGVLPGVTVTVANRDTGVAQTVVTDEKGLYQVLYLNPGVYDVTTELQGFKKVVRTGTDVRVGDTVRVDVTMETGGIAETVHVVAEQPLLNTTTGVSGTTIDSKQMGLAGC